MLSFSSWELAVVRRRLLAESVQRKKELPKGNVRVSETDFRAGRMQFVEDFSTSFVSLVAQTLEKLLKIS